ncbi:hypothetical protein ACE6H2_000461 [Prunus campanulata]
MDELRQIALAYYKDVPEHMKMWVNEFMSEIDKDGNEKVSLQEFLAYMGMYEDSKHLCTPSFFDELKQEGREELEFPDLLALFYIVSTGRPFGHCKNFLKGGYFTCVQCFFHSPKSFDLCADCYLNGMYVHHHKSFLDNFLVLKTKKTTVGDNLNQHGEASSITSKAKAPESGTGSTPAETINSSCSSPTSSSSSSSSSSSTTTATTAESTNDSTSSGTLTPGTSSSTTTSNALVPVNPRPNDVSSSFLPTDRLICPNEEFYLWKFELRISDMLETKCSLITKTTSSSICKPFAIPIRITIIL